MRLVARTSLAFTVVLLASAVASATPLKISGAATGSQATATGDLTLLGNTLTLTLKNTSPHDARITGLGFDLIDGDFDSQGPASSGLDGFSNGAVAGFTFGDGALGTVPQFNFAVLDFGWFTGSNFAGGTPNSGLAPFSTLTFIVTGNFLGLSEAQIVNGLFVRFQRVGINGDDSDVGRGVPGVPEPASLMLFGMGIAGAALVRRRRAAGR